MNQRLLLLITFLVLFTVECFSQVNIASITLTGNTTFTTTEILQKFETRTGAMLDKETLEHDIDFLISRYENNGYPFARVELAPLEPSQDSSETKVNISLLITEGQLVKIKEIRPTGNTETASNVIIRETGITYDEPYNQDRIKKAQNKISRLNIFSDVGKPELTMNDSGGVLIIPLVEGSTNTFDGVLGYVPSSGETDGFITGLINVSMRNLFGTARKLNVKWQREGNDIQEIALRYGEPWVFNFPVDLSLAFNQRQQDSTYVTRGYEIKADVRLFDEFSLAGILSYDNVIPSQSLTGASLFNTSTTSTGLELQYDSRDDITSPTSGALFRSDYKIGKKSLSSPTTIEVTSTVQVFGLDAAYLFQPFARQVVSIELHGKELLSDNIGIGEMYRLGGARTLRGYRENQFLGSRIGWTNLEYRFLLSRRSWMFGFFDTGYYFLPENPSQLISSSQSFKYGYGIGTRIETSIGIIGVSFALGERDSFSQGKIHIGLVGEF